MRQTFVYLIHIYHHYLPGKLNKRNKKGGGVPRPLYLGTGWSGMWIVHVCRILVDFDPLWWFRESLVMYLECIVIKALPWYYSAIRLVN